MEEVLVSYFSAEDDLSFMKRTKEAPKPKCIFQHDPMREERWLDWEKKIGHTQIWLAQEDSLFGATSDLSNCLGASFGFHIIP